MKKRIFLAAIFAATSAACILPSCEKEEIAGQKPDNQDSQELIAKSFSSPYSWVGEVHNYVLGDLIEFEDFTSETFTSQKNLIINYSNQYLDGYGVDDMSSGVMLEQSVYNRYAVTDFSHFSKLEEDLNNEDVIDFLREIFEKSGSSLVDDNVRSAYFQSKINSANSNPNFTSSEKEMLEAGIVLMHYSANFWLHDPEDLDIDPGVSDDKWWKRVKADAGGFFIGFFTELLDGDDNTENPPLNGGLGMGIIASIFTK